VIDLDGGAAYAAGDVRGFRQLLHGFAAQVAGAEQAAADLTLQGPPPRTVLVVGMGGSAAAGDLLQALCESQAAIAVAVARGYRIPAWVGPETAVIASSYSGDTEETIAAFDDARRRGARGLVVSSGGALADRAGRDGTPWLRVPRGLPPRTALPSLLVPVLVALERWGAIPSTAAERREAVSVLTALDAEVGPGVPGDRNPAKRLAAWLADRRAVIYGADLTAPVAYRWATQIEENAKTLAFSGTLPEMNHNAIEAWGAEGAGQWAVVMLRDAGEHPRIARRVELARSIIGARAATREVRSRGRGALARVLSLVLLGDWVSYYLAILGGVDPWAVPTLEGFKRSMGPPERPA
jgi:glucose/mannose-6-phosphate isomerase